MHKQIQDLPPMVPAQVRIIAHLLQEASEKVFPYLAVSTKPCFLCHHFAHQFQLKTGEPDYNQYSTWNLPEVLDISSYNVNKLVDATRRVAGDMRAQLLISIEPSQPEQGDNSATSGGTNAATGPGRQTNSDLRART